MKKKLSLIGLLFILFALLIPNTLIAQRFEVSPFTGFMLGGRVNYYNGYLKFEDGQDWGVILDVNVSYEQQIELSYSRLNTSVVQHSYTNVEKIIDKMTIDYIQLGSLYQFDINHDAFIPFFAGTLGATVFTAQDGGYAQTTTFSITLGGGVKIFPTEHFGIRLQARLLLPMQWGGMGIGCGTGGCGGGVYTSTTIAQGDFTAGIIIKL